MRLVLQQSTARKMHKWPTKTHPIVITLQTHVIHIPNNTIQTSYTTCIDHSTIYHGNIFFLFLKPYIHTCKLQGWKSIDQINMQSHISHPHIHQHAYNSSMAAKRHKASRESSRKGKEHLPLSMLRNFTNPFALSPDLEQPVAGFPL